MDADENSSISFANNKQVEENEMKFKRINDYIENHYHDCNSSDVEMIEGNGNENNGEN